MKITKSCYATDTETWLFLRFSSCHGLVQALTWCNCPTRDGVVRGLLLVLIMFRLVLTSSTTLKKSLLVFLECLFWIFFSSYALFEQLFEKRYRSAIFFFKVIHTSFLYKKKDFHTQFKRKILPFLTTADIKLDSQNSRCPNTVTLTSDYSKKAVRYQNFSQNKTAAACTQVLGIY